jgi:endoglucanase
MIRKHTLIFNIMAILVLAACSVQSTAAVPAVDATSEISTAIPEATEVQPTENPLDGLDADLKEAFALGIADEALLPKLHEPIKKADAAQLIKNANDLYFGEGHSKFLIDRVNEGKTITADKYWIAQNIYYARCEDFFDGEYTSAILWIRYCDAQGIPYEFFPDAGYALVRKATPPNLEDTGGEGTIGEMHGWWDITDIDKVWSDGGNGGVPQVVIVLYDRRTGVKVMSLDENQAFNPQEHVAVDEAIRIALRYYYSFPKYPVEVAYEDVGGYNKDIIPDELLNKPTNLPDASNQHLPAQWRGQMVPVMMHVTKTALDRDTDDILTEADVKLISEAGFNYIGMNISFSSLQEPFFTAGKVNQSQLEYLDQVLAWSIKYDVHLEIRCNQPPGATDMMDFFEAEALHDKFWTNQALRREFTMVWQMLARRYAGIPNKYLSFNLLTEPFFANDEASAQAFKPVIDAIRSESPDRVIIVDIHSLALTGEALAKLGVALSYHMYDPRSFCFLYSKPDTTYEPGYFSSVKWPYVDSKGEVWDAKAMLAAEMFNEPNTNAISALDLKATAEKYNVGFMIGEWGLFGTPPGQLLTETYDRRTIYSFYKDVIDTLDEQEIAWSVGNGWFGEYGIVSSYPAVEGVNYEPLENSPLYLDRGMFDFYKEILK